MRLSKKQIGECRKNMESVPITRYGQHYLDLYDTIDALESERAEAVAALTYAVYLLDMNQHFYQSIQANGVSAYEYIRAAAITQERADRAEVKK
jgi:hypothetical protein